MVLSVGVKSRTLLAQASGALTVVSVDPVVGWMNTIDCAPDASTVPWVNSIKYSVVADST